MSFSNDGKYLITQFNNQSWSLQLWVWEKAKSIGNVDIITFFEKDKSGKTIQVGGPGESSQNLVNCVYFSPKDDSIVSLSGRHLMKVLKYQDGNFRSIFTPKAELKVFSCPLYSAFSVILTSK